jgi:hypothetical protein
VTEDNAAPAADQSDSPIRESDSRNLIMRIAAAAVLIPIVVAIAYAGGWLWTALVTLAAIGLFVEWLAIVGLAGVTRAMLPGVAAPGFVWRPAGSMLRWSCSASVSWRSRRSCRSVETGRRRVFYTRRRPSLPRCWCASIPSRDSPR